MSKDEKGKIRILVFELEGSNETLKEGIRSLGNILGKTNYVKQLTPNAPVSGGELPQLTNTEAEEEQENNVITSSSNASRKTRKVRTPTILNIDFDSEPNLEEFLNGLGLQQQNQKYLAIAYWYKQYRNLPEITSDHVHTAFRRMQWKSPRDVSKPFRNMKEKNEYFDNGSKSGFWAINHIGENIIIKLLKK